MRDNAPPLTLAERMAEALAGCPNINTIGDRAKAYFAAGIRAEEVGFDEFPAADEQAVSIALARRLGGANEHA
jgi:hypothetical protein